MYQRLVPSLSYINFRYTLTDCIKDFFPTIVRQTNYFYKANWQVQKIKNFSLYLKYLTLGKRINYEIGILFYMLLLIIIFLKHLGRVYRRI